MEAYEKSRERLGMKLKTKFYQLDKKRDEKKRPFTN